MEETSTVQKRQLFWFPSQQFCRGTVKELREQERSHSMEVDWLWRQQLLVQPFNLSLKSMPLPSPTPHPPMQCQLGLNLVLKGWKEIPSRPEQVRFISPRNHFQCSFVWVGLCSVMCPPNPYMERIEQNFKKKPPNRRLEQFSTATSALKDSASLRWQRRQKPSWVAETSQARHT